VTLFVTTHYMDEATHCNRLAFIYRGTIIASGTPQEIKADLASDTILQLKIEDGEGALSALEGHDAVSEAYMQGAMLHVNVGARTAEQAGLIETLEKAGYPVLGVARVEPTLEDAFVHMVTQQGGRA
jgi:ABC-2 type transport system ATP-binding protein